MPLDIVFTKPGAARVIAFIYEADNNQFMPAIRLPFSLSDVSCD